MSGETNQTPLTSLGKIKQATALVASISALLTAAGGTFTILRSINQQDDVNESTYTLLSDRFEKIAVDIAVIQTDIKHMREKTAEIKGDIKFFHRGRYQRRDMKRRLPNLDEPVDSDYVEIWETEEAAERTPADMVVENLAADREPAPPKLKFKGKARLPSYKNIQQVVDHNGEAIQKEEIK